MSVRKRAYVNQTVNVFSKRIPAKFVCRVAILFREYPPTHLPTYLSTYLPTYLYIWYHAYIVRACMRRIKETGRKAIFEDVEAKESWSVLDRWTRNE